MKWNGNYNVSKNIKTIVGNILHGAITILLLGSNLKHELLYCFKEPFSFFKISILILLKTVLVLLKKPHQNVIQRRLYFIRFSMHRWCIK